MVKAVRFFGVACLALMALLWIAWYHYGGEAFNWVVVVPSVVLAVLGAECTFTRKPDVECLGILLVIYAIVTLGPPAFWAFAYGLSMFNLSSFVSVFLQALQVWMFVCVFAALMFLFVMYILWLVERL